jgi:hypothetical protein
MAVKADFFKNAARVRGTTLTCRRRSSREAGVASRGSSQVSRRGSLQTWPTLF